MAPHIQSKRAKRMFRLIIMGMITLMSIGALLWILNSEGIVQGIWGSAFNIVFTVLSAIFALLQWYAQVSTEPPILPASLSTPVTNCTPNTGTNHELSSNSAYGPDIRSLRPIGDSYFVQRYRNGHLVFVSVRPSFESSNETI